MRKKTVSYVTKWDGFSFLYCEKCGKTKPCENCFFAFFSAFPSSRSLQSFPIPQPYLSHRSAGSVVRLLSVCCSMI